MKSRERNLMKAGLGMLLAAGISEALVMNQSSVSSKSIPTFTEAARSPTPTETLVVTKTPEPSVTPTIPLAIRESTPEAYLQATVQALIDSGEHTTFVPEGPFTQELYEKVLNATYPIAILNDNGNTNLGTAFVIAKEGNVLYFMTSTHVIEENNEGPDLFTYIPRGSIHGGIFFQHQSYVVSETRDTAIIKATVPEDFARTVTPIQFIDNRDFTTGEQVLIVGWPGSFYVDEGIYTSAIITSIEAVSKDGPIWRAPGLINYGSSGSPVIIADAEGNPIIVGIVTKKLDAVSYPDGTFTVTRFALGYELEVKSLLDKLRQR